MKLKSAFGSKEVKQELVGGFIGTIAHTAIMLIGFYLLLPLADQQTPLGPYLITTNLWTFLTGVDASLRDRYVVWIVVSLAHFAYGTVCGPLYRFFQNRHPGRPVVRGLEFGFAYWVVNYVGWVPLSGMYNLFTENQPKHTIIMICATLAYGVAATYTIEALRRPRSILYSNQYGHRGADSVDDDRLFD